MNQRKVIISKSPAAIDAALITKDESATLVADRYNVPLSKVGTMGDGENDLPMLELDGLGYACAPANALDSVKEKVAALKYGFVSEKEAIFGVIDFYSKAAQKGIELLILDKDGVVVQGDKKWPKEFRKLIEKMGIDGPYITLLTGSSVQQNHEFIQDYNLTSLIGLPSIMEYPEMLNVENGAIAINIVENELINYAEKLSSGLLKLLKQEFEPWVFRRINNEILPEFGFQYSEIPEDQESKVYLPKKQTMVTINVPRTVSGQDYRNTPAALEFGDSVVDIMVDVAQKLHMPYQIL